MNNNTLQAYRDARAASDHLASEEYYEDDFDDRIVSDATVEATAQPTLRGLGWFGRPASGSVTIRTYVRATSTANITVTYAGGTTSESSVLVIGSLPFAPTIADRIVRELGRVKDGWAGPSTVAPPTRVLADVEAVAMRLPASLRMPAIEVDEEDGSVAIRWISSDRSRSFSLVFRGNGRVSGVLATIEPPRSSSWSLAVAEEVQIAAKLEENAVRDLIAS